MKNEKRILIVEDDEPIRMLIETVLRRRGFHSDAARNGIDALEAIRTCQYGLVILDLMMPRMSGHELLEHLGRECLTNRPAVLVLTAGTELHDFDSTLVVGTMHKPFDIELLVDTVEGCMAASSGDKRAGDRAIGPADSVADLRPN